ncbi:MAG: radical SAM protein [Spirochaetales bacterium]|nr:radical SAM protein [Spirochaetales bacterium]
MHIKKIIFIEPVAETLNIFTRFKLPRLGNILLATIMRDLGYDSRVCIEKKSQILGMDLQADLAAISTITATALSAYEIADHFRARGIPVVMGGPHVTFLPDEALEHADYVVRGEGEPILPALVRALENGTPLAEVRGLAFRKEGESIVNEMGSPVTDLNSLPFPDFDLVHNYRRNLLLGRRTIPVQTSRGCPFNCTFCSVTGMFGRRYRFRSVPNVIAELRRYEAKRTDVFFYDDNFAADKAHTKELLRAMIDSGLGLRWSTQVRTDAARDPALLDLMRRAGCTTLYIGFESVDPAALKEMRKSQTIEDMRRAVREIRKRGIHVHGMFVFGFDADTADTARATLRFAVREKIDTAQFLILTPFPGTPFYRDMEKDRRIIDRHWTHFDAHHVKFKPARLSGVELQRAQIRAHGRFYAPHRVVARLLRGKLAAFVIGLYARRLNRRWKRVEHPFLQWLKYYWKVYQ